ncbi:MAG: exo [Microbacterium sp.]|jgi:DNA polymerase-3 subunit epsilon|nr:exo [Microbacterium sp.]
MSEPTLGEALPSRIGVFDTETDGVDLEDTRIITAFIGVMDTATGAVIERHEWVLQPERPIPTVASDIHGYTTERAEREGVGRRLGLLQIAEQLMRLGLNTPIVAMNAIYDFTILDRELGRVGLDDEFGSPIELCERDETGAVIWPLVFDPMVFDRAIDKYRKGKRTLVDLCKVYGVPVEANAHDAEADCRMAGRVAIKLMGHSRLQDLTIEEVHRKLIATHRSNSLSLADYWQKTLNRLSGQERADKVAAIAEVRGRAGLWPCLPRT